MIVTLNFVQVAARSVRETLRSLGRLFTTMLLVSLAATWLLFLGIAYESYLNAWKATSAFAGNIEALLSLDIARSTELYELSIKAAADGFADPSVLALPPKVRQKVLFDQSAKASGLGSITIFDKAGALVADSHFEQPQKYNAADRDYFRVHAGKPRSRGLYISHPFKSRLHDDLWTVALSRRLDAADGSFAGVVIGTLKLGYFLHLFGAVQMPEKSVITLVHEDGTVLMRSRLIDIGRNLNDSSVYREMAHLQAGEITRVSQIDGVHRLYHFGAVDHLPVMLIIGLPIDDVLVAWRWRMAFIALGFAILSVFILLLAVALGRELHRRTLAERALVELAATDGMTALANRRHFDEALEEEWSRALRSSTSVALLMIDHDFFKPYNDTYGHLQGDQALRAVADALRGAVRRPADLVARFGGEEFAVLLPGTDLDGAVQVGEMIRSAVAAMKWEHEGSPFNVLTVSIGVAACLPAVGGDPISLVRAADFALYEAKERGRNQVATGERLGAAYFGWRAAG